MRTLSIEKVLFTRNYEVPIEPGLAVFNEHGVLTVLLDSNAEPVPFPIFRWTPTHTFHLPIQFEDASEEEPEPRTRSNITQALELALSMEPGPFSKKQAD